MFDDERNRLDEIIRDHVTCQDCVEEGARETRYHVDYACGNHDSGFFCPAHYELRRIH